MTISQKEVEQATQLPLAFVDGEPVVDLPQDLYIPPDALEVCLDAFEGPLDLLLYLIKKQNIDILNIPVAKVTRQYMDYIRLMETLRLELAAEYLLMAAMLTEIKSRMLLPRQGDDEDEEDDPRNELIRRLLEYERFKQAAVDIDSLPRQGRDTFLSTNDSGPLSLDRPEPDVSFEQLISAFRDVLARADNFQHHHIKKEILSIRQRMSEVLSSLQSKRFAAFTELFQYSEGRHGLVVTFIAVLELVKQSMVELVQTDLFSPIHLTIKDDCPSE